ncbi:MAG: glycosyltransferase [Bacteroidetes bacterium]|nr:glycosyltransferase [Bacteroidota bacterium]
MIKLNKKIESNPDTVSGNWFGCAKVPKLSIITINLNNASGLHKTMESVISQTSHDFEYIIIDGGSSDGSVEVIKSFTNIPLGQYTIQPQSQPITYWVSECDKGIYNAMNKGLKVAKGEYCQLLNSGDWLVDEQVVANMLNALTDGDIFAGNVVFVRPDGKIRYTKNTIPVSCLTFYRSSIQHTSAYIRRALFEKYGLYDESLKIVSDWKWYLLVAGLNKAKVVYLDINVSYFDTMGISSTNIVLEKAERRQVLEELLPAPILADYDKYHFGIGQMERIKKYKWLYRLLWFIERGLFKIEKWKLKCFGWEKKQNNEM